MTVYAIAAAVAVVFIALLFFRSKQSPDVSTALRSLLLARAEGKITAEEFEQRQAALHAAVLMPAQKPKLSGALKFGLPVAIVALAGVLYGWLGNPNAIEAPTATPPVMGAAPMTADGQPAAHTGGDLSEMVKRLADKLAKDPKNGEGWALLGHSYVELHKHAEAADAFAKAAVLIKPDANLLADWADAYVMTHDRKWDAKSRDIVKRALAADPKHLKALALAGSEAFDRKQYKEAIAFWKRMKDAAPADSMDVKLADANIQEATAIMTGKPVPVAPVAEPAAPVAANGGGAVISGVVTLASAMKGKVAPGDTVFIIAKAPEGGGPPLAVQRFTVADLPVKFRLDESSAMIPGRSIANYPTVVLTARVSKSGQPMASPGDVSSETLNVKTKSENLRVEIAKQL